ncbi:MAG: hypothetical protein FRX49_07761 [Trebouxia sp. A1-2]|nr:MAG: hypothetical protein FRX49_07761 [Trebouxia sp. A1-2]
MPTLKVGSSLVNLFRAFENAPEDSLFFGATARLMTGSGTVMLCSTAQHSTPQHSIAHPSTSSSQPQPTQGHLTTRHPSSQRGF